MAKETPQERRARLQREGPKNNPGFRRRIEEKANKRGEKGGHQDQTVRSNKRR